MPPVAAVRADPSPAGAAAPGSLPVALGVAALVLGGLSLASILACTPQRCPHPPTLSTAEAVLWAVGGLAYAGVGALAWRRRGDHGLGRLMMAVGTAWFVLPGQEFLESSLAATSSLGITWLLLTADLWVVVLVALVASFPSGSLTRPDRAVVGVVAGLYLAKNLAMLPWFHPLAEGYGDVANLLLVRADPVRVAAIEDLASLVDEPLLLGLVAWVLWRWWRSSRPQRRATAPVLWAGIPWVLGFLLGTVRHVTGGTRAAGLEHDLARVGLLALPFGFLAVVLHRAHGSGRLGQLLEDLGRPGPPGALQQRLATALGDPELVLAFPHQGGASHVDVDGRRVDLAELGKHRSLTHVAGTDELIAVLAHDPALERDPELLRAVVAGARLALHNERLSATIRAQLTEVRESRARIVEASDAERRRIERNLHDGAQQRLVSLGLSLGLARDRLGDAAHPTIIDLLDRARAEVAAATSELRQLASGIRPAILDEGLAPALEDLASRSGVPVDLDVTGRRLAPHLEMTAYFVVAEALTNVVKHAGASHAGVAVDVADDELVIDVTDDGAGGADPAGSGLTGLADRVAAAGGHLHVTDLDPGTRLLARIPTDGGGDDG